MDRNLPHPVSIMIKSTTNEMTTLTFDELDAILLMMEMHEWSMLAEHVDVDISLLYDKVSEMRDEVA